MEYVSPGDNLDFLHDATDWLPTGDGIATVDWTIETGLTLVSQTDTSTGSTAILLAGSQAGVVSKVDGTITTNNGLISTRSWFVTVQDQII